jgi:phage terminase small subunit
VLKRLVEGLTADLNDILNPDGSVKPVCEWPKIWRTGLVCGIRINELYEFDQTGKQGVFGHMKDLQFSDRIKRIALLGRHISGASVPRAGRSWHGFAIVGAVRADPRAVDQASH